MNCFINVLKDFLKKLSRSFTTQLPSIFAVFGEKPRLLIWLFVSYLLLISRYRSLIVVRPFFAIFVLNVILAIYIVFIVFVSSNIAEKILRYANGARRIATDTEKERLTPLFKEVYGKAFVKNRVIGKHIKPYIVDSVEVNAYVIGRNTIVLTRGAIETFNDEELKGIMAHEFGHLNNFDGQITLLIKFCTTIFLWIFIALSYIFRLLESLFENNIIGDIFGIVRKLFELVVKAVLFIWTLIVLGGSRKTEYKADMYAKSIGYGEELKSALCVLYNMEISNKKGLIENLKRTHPILAYRIEKLEH